jgi:hypothetical protein
MFGRVELHEPDLLRYDELCFDAIQPGDVDARSAHHAARYESELLAPALDAVGALWRTAPGEGSRSALLRRFAMIQRLSANMVL